ncbi:dTDP-4-dehydrorhamnose reductase [Paenibacillus cisolokensis]|nr:dTDP-4-dehydrorhamnose reductase [Paenibacillus cisolokensis]
MSRDGLHILVSGAGGQLGRELVGIKVPPSVKVTGMSRKEWDVTDLNRCREVTSMLRPDVIIHCAAYTAVDRAESDPDDAYRINAEGTRNVAVAAREAGAKLVYISTDYVFDGQSNVPYKEDDEPNPQTVYGKSKWAGEQFVQSLHDRYFIVRTSWVYGRYGSNFVKTMLKLGREKKRLTVVHDQIGSPTYTLDLARFLLELSQTDFYGVYHATNRGACSWYQFAKAIFEESGMEVEVEPCTTAEFPRPAPRPPYSVLDHAQIRMQGFGDMRPWREALRHFLKDDGSDEVKTDR